MITTGSKHRTRRAGRAVAASLMAWVMTGCSLDGLLKSNEIPPNLTDPAITETPAGALATYQGTVAQFRIAFGGSGTFVDLTALLSDELDDRTAGGISMRRLPEGESFGWGYQPFAASQKVRGQAAQAIG